MDIQEFQEKMAKAEEAIKEAEEIAKVKDAQAITSRKAVAKTYRNAGALAFVGGATQRALQYYIKSSELDPINPEVWRGLMQLYTLLGNTTAANEAQKKMESIEANLQGLKRVQK